MEDEFKSCAAPTCADQGYPPGSGRAASDDAEIALRIHQSVTDELGPVPFVVLVNKHDRVRVGNP